MLVYDIEIKNAIQGRGEKKIGGITYCDGWDDHKNMGISTVCVYDYDQDRYRAFGDDNIEEFGELICNHDIIVGFNNIKFDNAVIAAEAAKAEGMLGIDPPAQGPDGFTASIKEMLDEKSYDILVEIWVGAGLGREFKYPGSIGYSLDAMVKENGTSSLPNIGKTGNGAMAPILYQRGEIFNVVDYCLADVWLTKKLLDLIIVDGKLISPRNGKILDIKKPKGELT